MKKNKTAVIILITYILMQLSGIVFGPPIIFYFQSRGNSFEEALLLTSGWWMSISMFIAVVVTAILSYRDKNFYEVYSGKKSSIGAAILWGIIGFFMVLLGQMVAGQIEYALGIEPGSENTMALVEVSKAAPVAIFAIVIFAPILEEVIFRRVIFGSLIKRTNFFISAAVSAIVFGAIHMEFTHILLYAASGFIFAFLYYKTKRLLTSIIAHMLLNGFVVLVNLNYDKIEQFVRYMEEMQKIQ